MFAGVYCRSRDHELDSGECAQLKGALSRFPGERVEVIERPGLFVAVASLGVYPAERIETSPSSDFFLTAGDPLMDGDPSGSLLPVAGGDLAILKRCRGTYSGLGFQVADHRLVLVSDRLGVRPIYYSIRGRFVYFATALRMLEACRFLRLTVDLRGAIESATFGYSMAERTPYTWVRRIGAAEVVSFEPEATVKSNYFRWTDIPAQDPVDRAGMEELTARFDEAVALRLRGRREADAFLSGGLDSRCIVAALLKAGARVRTYNASWEGSVDKVVGRLFAERAGTDHTEIPLPEDAFGDAWPRLISDALRPDGRKAEGAVAWSGDGGSVGVGRVHLDAAMVELLRAEDMPGALQAFFAENPTGVPVGASRRSLRDRVREIPRDSVRAELLGIDTEDRGQSFFLFLLLNDQHRHMTQYYEDLDVNRIEYELPFFDAEFLTRSASFRIDECLGHRMYNRWTESLPSAVREVPWQSYPGHEPGPIPMPSSATPQWAVPRGIRRKALRDRMKREALELLSSDAFPDPLLDRGRMRLMLEASRIGLRDYTYAFSFGRELERYWKVAEGRYA